MWISKTKQKNPPSFNLIVKRRAAAHGYTRSAYHLPQKQNHSWRAAASWISPAGHFMCSARDAARCHFGEGQGNPCSGLPCRNPFWWAWGCRICHPCLQMQHGNETLKDFTKCYKVRMGWTTLSPVF